MVNQIKYRIQHWLKKLNIAEKMRGLTTRKKTITKEWLKENSKKISLILIGTIIAALVVAISPAIANQYDTYISIPSHFTDQEREQVIARWKEILNSTEKGKNSAGMYNNIGILRGSLKDYTGAIRAFKRAKRRNPEDPRFDRNMGITYTYMKKYGSAEKAFKDAITLAPKQSEYWLELGELYSFYLKDYGAAKRFYLDMMAKNSGDMDILKAYANFSENINHDYREALIYWQILQDNDRDHAGDYEKKIGALKKKLQ